MLRPFGVLKYAVQKALDGSSSVPHPWLNMLKYLSVLKYTVQEACISVPSIA